MSRYRFIDGLPMGKKSRKTMIAQGFRVYDAKCPYRMSHTKHFCYYDRCPEG